MHQRCCPLSYKQMLMSDSETESDSATESDDDIRSLVVLGERKRNGKMPMIDTRNIRRKKNEEGKKLYSSAKEIEKQFNSKPHIDQVEPQCGGQDGRVVCVRRGDSQARRHQLHNNQHLIHQVEEEEEHVQLAKEQPVHQAKEHKGEVPQYYGGGPYDLTVLTQYKDHIARKLWFGQERGAKKELKVVSHGKKLQSWVPPQLPPLIHSWLEDSGLSALQKTSMKMVDTNLLSAFVERWHPETSSFHMPFGEMTITLYDVACLLHLPVRGDFYDYPPGTSEEGATALAQQLLGVTYDEARAETRRNRGSYYSREWLYGLFVRHCQTQKFGCAARAYMLLLVASTIFTDKSFTLVEAKYLPLFRNLSNCGRYCWGPAALVTLYEYLGDGSTISCKTLGGYVTLLQCWIHEYFPTLGNRVENQVACDEPGMGAARAMRWRYKQSTFKVDQLRKMIDDLTPNDVIWCPFESHRQVIPFDDICLYNGCLRWCGIVVPYLPERCLRQFGYIQYIPRPPPDLHTFDIDAEWADYHSSVHRIIADTHLTICPFEVTETYMEWYYRVSHPRLIRPTEGHPRRVPAQTRKVLDDVGPSDSRLSGIIKELEGCASEWGANPEDPIFRRFFRALEYARGGPLD